MLVRVMYISAFGLPVDISHQFPVLAKYLAEAGRLSEVNTDFLDSTSERAKPPNPAKLVRLVNVNRRNTLLISI